MTRPLLFLDVDGPLIPIGGGGRTYQAVASSNPLLARVDPALGPRLLTPGCDLVWATTWMEEANECVAPLLGLPALPVLNWPDSPDDEHDARMGLHWKTRRIVEAAAESPFIWVDDEITDIDRTWVARHHRGRALLHAVTPAVGLTMDDIDTIAAWLRATD
ncbi:HAD domain-containing protein [Actinophytocola sp.]|uniref:HAD domain-containing protein n=1 Tax=Actinophytocola sp. TaxID=1872138 RepID=UPI002D660AD0|nr:HAD domain-containing protein [Actinophytocola sp.]HYQ65379.1 HAD domain-containing protein [Actinophytocola sp.]